MKKIFSAILCAITILMFSVSAAPAAATAPAAGGKASDVYLVSEGKSNYKIMYPAGMSSEEYTAVEELTTLFYDATGVFLEAVDDSDVFVFLKSYTYISVGATKLAELARVTYDSEKVGQQGYHLETKGNSMFIMSDGFYGLIYGVYQFLTEQFGYDYYAKGEWSFDKPTDETTLVRVKLDDKPDMRWRSVSFQEQNDVEYARRMRAHRTKEGMLTTNTIGSVHNALDYVETIKSGEHPNWFSPTKTQLCYSRDVEGLSDYILKQMKELLRENPHVDNLTLTQMDNPEWCNCTECEKIINAHGGFLTSTQILFINVLAKKLDAWVKEEFPGREVTLGFFAYWQTIDAPVKRSGDKFVPISDDMILADNAAVYYAPIYANYFYEFDNLSANREFYEHFEKWSAVSSKFFFWPYGSTFGNYFNPFNLYNSLQSLYRVAKRFNTVYFFDQIQLDQACTPDWGRLKIYLQSKLAWDSEADLEFYIDKFFKHYFDDASSQMRLLFDQMRAWTVNLAKTVPALNIGSVGGGSTDAKYWPEVMLKGWLSLIDESYQAIDYLKVTDPEKYEILRDRICLESLTIRDLYRLGYSGKMPASMLTQFKAEFLKDCRRLGVNRYSENYSIDAFYA